MNKKFKNTCIVLTIFLVLILAINSAIYSKNGYKKGDNSSIATINEIREAEKSGKVVTLDSEELNNIISIIYNSDKTKGNITLKTPEGFLEDSNLGLKLPVSYKKKEYIIYIKGFLNSEEDSITFTPKSIKLGSLPLPKNMVLKSINKYLNEDIKVENGVIKVNKKLAPFAVEWIKVENGELSMKINKLVPDSLLNDEKNVKIEIDKIKDELNNLKEKSNDSGVKNKIDEVINKIDKSGNDAGKIIDEVKEDIKDVDKEISDKLEEIEKKNNEKKASLNKVSSQLSNAVGSTGSKGGEEIIGIMISTINKISADDSYKYSGDVASVKSIYSKLSSKEKEGVKKAIISNVDLSLVGELRATFGI